MDRRVTTQDISWFLDLNNKKQLQLKPPYQRKSVWTTSDRIFFLDTIFRNYPTGAVFLHKSIDEEDNITYNVVDGKQRLETILLFANDELRISSEFGNSDLSGKKFSELSRDYKRVFWNYPMTVEQFEQFEGATVNQIFDRLNRNTHKLTRQELRHAQFGGEFITFVEADAETYFWSEVGISTKARARRMKDIEFIAELFVLTINGIVGSDADGLDEYFGKYDEEVPDFEKNKEKFELVKRNISNINQYHNIEESRYKNFADFYSLFASILEKLPNQINAELTADNLKMFEVQLRILSEDESNLSAESLPIEVLDITKYERAVRGASSDINPRRDRAEVIGKLLVMSQ